MDKSHEKDELLESVASLSKVSKSASKFSNAGAFAGICAVCIGIFTVMVWPSKDTKVEIERADNTVYLDNTLQDNLEEANKLKLSADNARFKAMLESQQKKEVLLPAPMHRMPVESSAINRPIETQQMTQEVKMRMNAATTFINNDSIPISQSSTKDKSGVQEATILSKGADGDFLNSQGEYSAVSAHQLAHPDFTVPAGEMIAATLETAVNSELPGMVKAITTRDIYSLTDNRKLIPRGSTLVGQFNSGVVKGQSRIAVIWDRLQLPGGIIVSLKSPGTDSMGRSGQGADYVNRHFFERFGSSVMLSLLGFYASNNGVSSFDQMNSKAMMKSQIANSMQAASSAELEQSMDIKPTIHINQGANINIFVAHDLSFYKVMGGEV